MDWSGVDYCDVFISSRSDGTHSLQSIHCWDTDAETHFWWRNWSQMSTWSANVDDQSAAVVDVSVSQHWMMLAGDERLSVSIISVCLTLGSCVECSWATWDSHTLQLKPQLIRASHHHKQIQFHTQQSLWCVWVKCERDLTILEKNQLAVWEFDNKILFILLY